MTTAQIIKTIIEVVAVLLLIYGYTQEERIATWEREQMAKAIKWFRQTRACKELRRMIRAYEMAHQEVRR